MQRFDADRYNSGAIRHHALQFDTSVFNRQITAYVENAWAAFSGTNP